jgi:cell filamentation protein
MAADDRREGLLAANRIAELQENPVKGRFDAAHLKEIHRRIFQDMPHYAPGEYRPDADGYNKARALESSGHRYYVNYPGRGHGEAIDKTLTDFGGPAALRGLSADVFSEKMAKIYADLDHQHPFVEGNSRTLRSFTAQLAQDAGYDLDWKRANGTEAGRDRLYIARDVEVVKRAYPGLDEARAMVAPSREEYEAYALVLAPFGKATSLQQIIKNATFRAQDIDAAKALREQPAEEAIKAHPDLAGSFAKLSAIDHKTTADGLALEQRASVIHRAREALAVQVERGQRPEQSINEQRQVQQVDREAPDR